MKLKSLNIKLRLKLKKLIIDFRGSHLRDIRNSVFYGIKKIPDIVHLKNLALFGSIVSIIILSLFVQRFTTLRQYFIEKTPTTGGVYKHGVIGDVDKVNPLFIRNDAEEAATKMVYSGLTKVVNGVPVADLAESWTNPDPKTYIFKLRDNIFWHDGSKLSADDVLFTFSLIQNPDTRTPLGNIWKGVTFEKISDQEIKITLPNAFPDFLEVCSEPILPKHILEIIDPKNIKVAEFNQNPIGSGPYVFDRFDQVGENSEIVFKKNENYYIDNQPYIEEIHLVFFEDKSKLVDSLERRQIDGAFTLPGGQSGSLTKLSGYNIFENLMPAYSVALLNYKNEFLSVKENRIAVSRSINRESLISNGVTTKDNQLYGPLLPGTPGFNGKQRGQAANLTAAKDVLEKAGWLVSGDGVRKKDGRPLTLRLAYLDNEQNRAIADILVGDLKSLGIAVDSKRYDAISLQQNIIRPRDYDILLVQQNVGLGGDLYNFWHSSQITDPGQNFTGFKDRKIDKLLEQVRKSIDKAYIAERNKQIEQAIIDDGAGIFLFRSTNKSIISTKVLNYKQKKISRPIEMLNNVNDWFIKYKEVIK